MIRLTAETEGETEEDGLNDEEELALGDKEALIELEGESEVEELLEGLRLAEGEREEELELLGL